MNDFKYKLRAFMTGRYGTDRLNRFLFWLSVICLVLSFFGLRIFSRIALVFIIIYIFRMTSKDYNRRYRENQIYLKHYENIRWKYGQLKQNIIYRKTHKIFKCKKCGRKLSVPKGKGTIEISCPCGNKFKKRT